MKKNIIVTGGLGFIGSNLIDLLIKKNYYVINIDKSTYSSNQYNVKHLKNNKKYKFIKCSIGNKNKVFSVLKKYNPLGIINLAAETHVDRSIENPKKFFYSNVLELIDLLEVTKKYLNNNKKFKFLHVSTDEVYGDVLKGRSTEEWKYKPSSPYAASKASSDHIISSYIRTFKLPCLITNCSNNYGPRQHPEKLIPKIIFNILNNKKIPIYGNGKNSREWIYVEDHCLGILKVFEKGKIGEFYNIGSNLNISNLEIAKKIIKISKKYIKLEKNVKIQFVKDRPGHDIRYALNSKKINKRLKWKTRVKIDKGLEKTFLWYFENLSYFSFLNRKDIINRIGLIK